MQQVINGILYVTVGGIQFFNSAQRWQRTGTAAMLGHEKMETVRIYAKLAEGNHSIRIFIQGAEL